MITCKLFDLPLGSRFRYLNQSTPAISSAYVLLNRSACGLVANAPATAEKWPGQGIYSAADTPAEFRAMLVQFVPVVEVP